MSWGERMPLTLTEANVLMQAIREEFAAGAKSGNKAYVDEKGSELDSVAWDATVMAKGAASKQEVRNNNATVADGELALLRNDGVQKTVLWYGAHVLAHTPKSGNCLELSCAAAYRASKKASLSQRIGIAVTDGPGDHVFCVVGPIDGWQKLEQVPSGCANSIVIDPWANVCCLAKDYLQQFSKQMNEWFGKGKRIAAGPQRWLAPDDSYIAKLKASTLDMRVADGACGL